MHRDEPKAMRTRFHRLRRHTALLAAIGLGACSSPADQSVAMVRDSAGIPIIESTEPVWDEGLGWTVEQSPALDLGAVGSGPAYEFYVVTDADRLPDGSVVVADDGSDEVRVFSAAGEHRWSVGRDGEGPGEFQRLDQVWSLAGDSIVAYDFWAARLTVFGPDRSVGRVETMLEAGQPRPVYPLSDGGYVGMSTDFTGFGDEVGLRRWRHPILRLDAAGTVVDTLTTIQGAESVVFSSGDAVALWGKRGHLAVRGSEILVGSADGVEFHVLGPDGELRQIVRAPEYDLELSSAEVRAELNALFPDSLNLSATAREIRDAQPARTHRPGYQALVIDELGNTWLQAYEAFHEAGEPREWLVFDAEGQWLGIVELPPRFQVFRIGEDWILGKRIDELDVEHVQVLSLSRVGRMPGEALKDNGR